MKSRFKKAKGLLIFWTLFVGIGAVGGAAGMLLDTSGKAMGMDALLPYFQKLPFADVLFQNFLFPGIALLIVNGITNLTAAALLFMKKKSGVFLGGLFGVTLMLWICIQFYMLPANFMSTAFFIIGFLQAITGYAAWVFQKQESFKAEESDFKNIGTNKKRLVIYFSRMGYVKKAALEEAEKTGAEILEVKAAERTEGTLGFWWCGRFGMHKWAMPIEKIDADLSKFDHVTICSPIWVFTLAAPMKEFCKTQNGKIKEADYIILHHMKAPFDSAADEADSLLGLKRTGFKSICCRKGTFKTVKEERSEKLTK